MALAAMLAGISVIALIAIGAAGRDDGARAGPRIAAMAGRELGSPTAPITLQVWEDFQCPFCKQVNLDALDTVERTYVDSGQVRIEFHHYAFLGAESIAAAEASECANEQHQFWPYHDALFATQAGENRGAFSTAKLKQLARATGLDTTAFDSCLDSGRYRQVVQDERREGQRLGISSTPTFFVNGQIIKGMQPFAVFRDAIDQALTQGEARP
jgi:protein-disulfide isomerase